MKILNDRVKDTAKVLIVKAFIKGALDITPYVKKLKEYNIKPTEVIYVSLFDSKVKDTIPLTDLRAKVEELAEFLKIHGNITTVIDEVGYRDKKNSYIGNLIFKKIFHKDTKLWSSNGILKATLGDYSVKMICGFRGESIKREMAAHRIIDTEFEVDLGSINVEVITSGIRAKTVFKELYKSEELYYDTETNSLRWEAIGSKLLTIQFTGSDDIDTSYVMFIDHKDKPIKDDMKSICSKGTKWLLESGKKVWIHNANFDLLFTKMGLVPDLDFYKVNSYDSMIIYHFLTNTYKDVPLGLKESAFVNKVCQDWETDLEMAKTQICKDLKLKKDEFNYELFDADLLSEYAGMDTIVLAYYVKMLWRLNEAHPARIELDIINQTWKGNWQNIMQSIQWSIWDGVPFDIEECKRQLEAQEAKVVKNMEIILKHPDIIKTEARLIAKNFEKANREYDKKVEAVRLKNNGKVFTGAKPSLEKGNYGAISFDVVFNPKSDAHKRVLLLEVLGLNVLATTDTNLASVGSEQMSKYFEMRPDLEILQLFNEISLLGKEITTYLSPWKSLSETTFDGNLRSNFTPTATSLRLRSRSPALLNITKTDIKKCVATTDGTKIFQADYSGLEDNTMLFRHLDKVKLELKDKGITDSHSINAIIIDKALNRKELDGYSMTDPADLKKVKDKFPQRRQQAKALTFAMAYLGSHLSIAASFQVDTETAMGIYNTYWDTYKGERQFFIDKVEEMEEKGFMVNFGLAPIDTRGINTDINDKNNMSNIRTCYNSIGQSSAYATLRAMDKTMRRMKVEGVYYRAFLSVYDSIIYTCKDADAVYIREVMDGYMREPIMENQPYELHPDFEIGHTYKAEEDFEGTKEELEEILARFLK